MDKAIREQEMQDAKERNLVWQQTKVTYEQHCELLGQKGLVVWFTGLSGAGKSTIATEVERLLCEQKVSTYMLDGDNIRHGVNRDLGFSDADRNENIRRISEIAALFQDAGIVTLVAFISPFKEMREFARACAGAENFVEVYVKADLETCRKRDPKGLYQKKINNFTGIDSSYEEPDNADIVLDTTTLSVEESAKKVIEEIQKRLK